MKFKDWLEDELKNDPEFRAEWEASEPEYQFRKTLIGARLAAGLTQAELAERIGTKQPAIARLEGGSATPTFSMLQRLAAALNVSFEIMPSGHVTVHEHVASG